MNNFSCNVWIERDRKVLTLYFMGQEVLTLSDEAVDEAIEGGFLATPRKPRPSEDDWLDPLINYASETGRMNEWMSARPVAMKSALTFMNWYDSAGHWIYDTKQKALNAWRQWGIRLLPPHSEEAERYLQDWMKNGNAAFAK
jgi:hypothetical protein